MGYFSKIGESQFYAGGKYVSPGLYLASIERVKQGQTRNGRPFFVVEMKVLESSNPKEHPLSVNMSWMVMLDQDAALGNVRHFISVASETPFAEVTERDAEDAVSEQNPLAGIALRVMAVNVKTRAGKDFTKVTFMNPEHVTAEDAAKQHAKEIAAPAAA